MPIGAGGGANIGGGIGGIIGAATAGGGGKDFLKLALKAFQDLKTSNFDMRSLPAPTLEVLAQATPEVFQATTPEEFQQIEDGLQGRAAQLEAVGQLGQYAQEGTPLADRLTRDENARAAESATTSATDAALRSLGARGALSGGDEIQARLGAGQQGANLARDLASSATRDEATRRLGAIEQLGQAGGELRAGDVNVSAQKAAIGNRFKELFANTMNQANQYNAGARERAQATNVEAANQTGQANAMNKYNVDLANLERQNRLKGDIFGQETTKAKGLSGAYGDLADWEDAQRAERIGNSAAIGSSVGGLAGGFI